MQRLTRTLAAASALAFTSLLAGCGDDVSIEPDPSITLTPPSATLAVGQTAQFSATVVGLANKTVTWSSSSANATVDNTGKVTAVSAGTATIIAATSDANVKASAIVTITPANKGVQKVEISPNADILGVGQTRQLNANVTRDPGVAGTVTWSSSNTAVATISTSGVVTAVTAGSAIITAASTVDPTVSGTAAITVRPPQAATISIQKVTVTGNTNQTVNFNNVAGGIDVTLNVDPGDQVLQRVEVLLDGVVVCTQNFSASQSRELSLAAVFDELEAVDVLCQINTAEFAQATGAVKFFNGVHQLSARAIVQGGTQSAAPSVALTFNNASGFVATITNTNTNTGFPNSAVNPNTGQAWTQGTHVLTLAGVNYACGAALANGACPAGQATTYTNINVQLFGKNTAATPAAGGQLYTITYSGTTGWTSTNTGLDNYQSVETGELPSITAAALSNGQNGTTTLLNPPGGTNATLTPISLIRVDNVDPGAAPVNPVVPVVTAVAPTLPNAFPLWVNSSFAFAASTAASSFYNQGVDSGVDSPTTAFYYIAAAALPGAANSCDLTGMTAITTGAGVAETLVSTTYKLRAVTTDRLGNRVCRDVSTVGFGADFQVPSVTASTGPANNSGFNTTPVTGVTFTVTDNASGFGATPVTVTTTRLNADGTTSCIFGTTTATVTCTASSTQPLNFDPTAGTNGEGYYTQIAAVRDQAGNVTATTTTTFLVDVTAPSFTAGLSLPSLITGNAAASFTSAAADNIDLNGVFGTVAYTAAGYSIQYPAQSLGSYGPPLEKTAPVNFTIAQFIRCMNAAGDFASTTNKAASILLSVTDQASNVGTLGPTAIPGANIQNCAAIAAPGVINSFTETNAVVSISRDNPTGNTLAQSVNLTAVADVALNSTNDPFQRVEFYWNNGGTLTLLGSATGVLAQSPTTRTWTYTLANFNPAAPIPTGGTISIVAVGVTAGGDAVPTAPNTNITVAP
jgi:hypothetical protein